ncbi:MAG: hypothetical protein AABY11_03635 [archaeon]
MKKEVGFHWRGLFIEADGFFERVGKNEDTVVLSELFFNEVRKIIQMEAEDVVGVFDALHVKTERYSVRGALFTRQFKQKGIHQMDATHLAISIQAECQCVVTFNLKDFERQQIIQVYEPATFQ